MLRFSRRTDTISLAHQSCSFEASLATGDLDIVPDGKRFFLLAVDSAASRPKIDLALD
jgi:hypothetical protein